ncbi:XdhC family protein [Galbibacter mesophilus]|uniref:XdhC family protein n=1 Tax=Galbibacter mesophilus TaxID=379069 RepID=UPI00191E2450|nr:XdhC/CoxI family protein [Galbibacter mesophilus]MCM5661991.1 XdhC family protein [Galbibacter mesophilus]
MTHEFQKIVESHLKARKNKLKTVLVTVVALEGSSYRRPGVRMLIREDGKMTGAVSGGCVEKEILRQSATVFKSGIAKVMMYDGRYRLGCEGILYILIEPFLLNETFLTEFNRTIKERTAFSIISYFQKEESSDASFGSVIFFENGTHFPLSEGFEKTSEENKIETFTQRLKPSLKLIIIGAEHDSVQLCALAALNGWEVIIVAPEDDARTLENFPGALDVINSRAQNFDYKNIDEETAVILMTHSFTKDLQFLKELLEREIKYIGILGPVKRREQLFQKIIEDSPDVNPLSFEKIHAPAGINIGAETPQEIAVSIISEILAVFRGQTVFQLKERNGRIHS